MKITPEQGDILDMVRRAKQDIYLVLKGHKGPTTLVSVLPRLTDIERFITGTTEPNGKT